MRPPLPSLLLCVLILSCGAPQKKEASPAVAQAEEARKACVDGASCGKAAQALVRGGDFATAAELLRKGCDGGDVPSCVELGHIHREGRAGPADPAGALRLYQKGCDALDAEACYRVGVLVVDADIQAGVRAFRRSCSKLHGGGCFHLGNIHLEGLGGLKDEGRGVYFLKSGCKQKSPEACERLSRLYADPRGRWHDDDIGHDYLFLACRYGDEVACKKVDATRKSTPLQNRSAGTFSVDGVQLRDLSCDLQSRGSMALMRAVDVLGKEKPTLDSCGSPGLRVDVSWRWERSAVVAVRLGPDVPPPTARCVEMTLRRLEPPRDGKCNATLVLGDAASTPPPAPSSKQRRRGRRR